MVDIFIILAAVGVLAILVTAGLWLFGHVATRRLAWRYFRSTPVTILGVLGIGVGLTVVLVIQSVVAGLLGELHSRLRAVGADMTLNVPFNQATLDQLNRLEKVQVASPQMVVPVAIIRIGPQDDFVIKQCHVVGIDPQQELKIEGIRDYMDISGELEGNWIIGGANLFGAPQVNPGQTVLLQLAYQEDGAWTRSAPEVFKVVGIVETGIYNIDRTVVYVPISFLQKKLQPGQGKPSIKIHLKPGVELSDFIERDTDTIKRILKIPSEIDISFPTYKTQYGHYLRAVEDQGGKLVLISTMIILVSAVCILATIIMITLQKTRDIGILRSFGAGRRTILGAFLGYALLVSLAGAALGLGATALAIWKIDYLKLAVIKVTGWNPINKRIYTEEKLPADWKAPVGESRIWAPLGKLPFILLIPGATIGLVALGALIPVWLAARRDPVEAILYE